MPLPTYDEFVGVESVEVSQAILETHGHNPSPGDMYHNAWRRLVEGWTHANILHDIRGEPLEEPPPEPPPVEPPPVEPPPVEPPPVAGRPPLEGWLRVDRRHARPMFADNRGGRLSLNFHAGTMLWEFSQDEERCIREFFEPGAAAGYHGPRTWFSLNNRGVVDWWNQFGVRFSPRDTADFEGVVRRFCYRLAEFGFQAHFASGGSEGYSDVEYERLFAFMGDVLAEVELEYGPVCSFFEGQNEVLAPTGPMTPARLERLVKMVMARRAGGLHGLSGLGDTGEDRELAREWTPDWQEVVLQHLMRQPGARRLLDLVQHTTWLYDGEFPPVRALGNSGEPGAFTRFRNGGVSGMHPSTVAELDEEGHSLYAAAQCLCRWQGTLMSDPGVTGPRFHYPFEDVPGWYTAPLLVQAIEDFAPDVHSWKLTHRGSSAAAIRIRHESEVRIPQLVEDRTGRAAGVVVGENGTELVFNGRVNVELLHANEERKIVRESFSGVSSLPVSYRRGRIVLVD